MKECSAESAIESSVRLKKRDSNSNSLSIAQNGAPGRPKQSIVE